MSNALRDSRFPEPAARLCCPMESLSGTVERVTYHTEDTGYSVLKVKIRGRSEPVTVTGRVVKSVLEPPTMFTTTQS